MELSAGTIQKLKPYLGAKGGDAKSLLKKKPLIITTSEASELDKAVKQEAISLLRLRYLSSGYNTTRTDFFDLPSQAQTVIASVSFQYGDLSIRTPKFWNAVVAQDWTEAARILRNFGDAYPSRRKLEADLLEEIAE